MAKQYIITVLMMIPLIGFCQFGRKDRKEGTLKATQVYDAPDDFSFVSVQAFPFSVQNNLSSTSISFGTTQRVMLKSKLILSGTILKAYTDELVNQNDGSSRSLSVYKERSTFEWLANVEYPIISKLTETSARFSLKQIRDTVYVTDLDVKRLITANVKLGLGYRSGHITDFANKLEGIQIAPESPDFPFSNANRTILDCQYLTVGIVRNSIIHSAYEFDGYGTRSLGRINSFYADFVFAYNYTLDNIVMVKNPNTTAGAAPDVLVLYNLQTNTPFRRVGAKFGCSSTSLGRFYSQTLGIETGVLPGVGFDFFTKIYVAIGLVRKSQNYGKD
jgi:hypothetical protein